MRQNMVEELADQLARAYDYIPLTELELADPDAAEEHRNAANYLSGWLSELPKQQERAAFHRGWNHGWKRGQERGIARANHNHNTTRAAADTAADAETPDR